MTTDYWTRGLAQAWHMTAELHQLDGEYDLNFLAQGADGHEHIVKVMRPGCAPELIDLQIRALEHIAAKAPDLPLPAVIRTQDGAAFAEVVDADGQTRLIWVLSKLPGRCYARVAPKGLDLIQQVGGMRWHRSRAGSGSRSRRKSSTSRSSKPTAPDYPWKNR